MSYDFEENFEVYQARCEDGQTNKAMINYIIKYIDDIWGFKDFSSWFDSAAPITGSAECNDFPYMDLIANRQENKDYQCFGIGNTIPCCIDSCDVFILLNGLFENVYLEYGWEGVDSVGGNTYHYECEYNPFKLQRRECAEIYGFSCNNWRKSNNYSMYPAAPKIDMVDILIEKSASEGNAELTSMLLDLKNRIQAGLLPDPELCRKYMKKEYASLKRRIKASKTLMPSWRDAILDQLKTYDDEHTTGMIEDSYLLALEFRHCREFDAADQDALLNAVIRGNAKTARELYEKIKHQTHERRKEERRQAAAEKRWSELHWKDEPASIYVISEWGKKQRLSESKLLEEQLQGLQAEFKECSDISLLGTEVMTVKGPGTVIEQDGAKILVKTNSDVTGYILHANYPKRPRFKGDEKFIEMLSRKYELSIKMRQLEYKLSALRKQLAKCNTAV